MFCEKISWESIRQRQLLHNFFFVTPKIIDYSYSLSDLTYCTSQVRATIFHYPNGSWCPLPRRVKATIANAIVTPIAVPYVATDASAMNTITCSRYLSSSREIEIKESRI